MGHVIVIMFLTLDGVISDPDGADGTPQGGWAFRHGPGAVAGDKFRLGATLDTGVMLLGRNSWERFARIWPTRTDEFSERMNAVDKIVATNTTPDLSAWANSTAIDGDLAERVRTEREHRDVITTGSITVLRALQRNDLVDEYRLLTFPSVIGTGDQLFDATDPAINLRCTRAEQADTAVLSCYEVTR